MSAIPPKADIKKRCRDVRYVPKADIRFSSNNPCGSTLKPVDGGGAEVREAVSRPQSAVSSETIAVVGPGGDLRVAPSLVCDAGKARQQQEAQIVEVGDGLAPDRGFYSRDVRGSTRAERFGGFPIE